MMDLLLLVDAQIKKTTNIGSSTFHSHLPSAQSVIPDFSAMQSLS